MNGLISKSGNPFDAYLKLVENKIEFDFDRPESKVF
ncbi:MAG TPA: topoisomerase C-terminal repeat-containing protein [Lachnospiraceae bacterium]|nr:topoisomerase C-terminal repeat-containing protein [Lachnospiraceae bacterium]